VVERIQTHQHAKFCQNWSIGCEYIKIFRLFKMAAAAVLDFQNYEFLFAAGISGPRRIIVSNFVTIARSIVEILWFFEFSRWPPPPSWIFEIGKFYWLLRSRGWIRISLPNFVKIGQSVAKIIRFFDFSRWWPSPSWIFKIVNFYLLTVSGGVSRITLPNIVKIGRFFVEILRLFEFSRWPPPPSWMFEIAKFYSLLGSWVAAAILYCGNREFLFAANTCRAQTHQCSEFRQNRSFRCGDIAFFRIFKMAAAAILDFWNREILLVVVVQSMETHHHAQFRQNRSIGCKGIKIFLIFQDGGRRHLGFSKSWIFICWRSLEGSVTSLYQTLSKSVASLRRYCDYSNF